MSQIVAEQAQPVSRTRNCAPWCAQHVEDDYPGDGYCKSRVVEVWGHRAFIANGEVPGQGRPQRIHVERTSDHPYDYCTPGVSVVEAAHLGAALQELAREAMAKA